jgi:hypothetical protein
MPDVGTAPPAAPPTLYGAYTPRVLPPDEWERLRDLPFATNGLPDPATSVIIVTETAQGEIVGLWALLLQPMLDGLWVHPDHRQTATRHGSVIAGHLLRTMKAFLQEFAIPAAFTVISDPAVMTLAVKAGFERAPGDLWILTLPPKEGT